MPPPTGAGEVGLVSPVPLAPPGANAEVCYPAPGEFPTMTLRQSLSGIRSETPVEPDTIPELPQLAYQEQVNYAQTVHVEEPQYLENLHNVEVQTAVQETPIAYDYQHPDDTIFEPTITEDEIYVGALVTEAGEKVANLQQSIRRNKAQKEVIDKATDPFGSEGLLGDL